MFATEAVTGVLPVHISARVLGHKTLTTPQAHLAVFQDDLVRTYRGLLDRRRADRPQDEYREPTEQEWHDFQQHFELGPRTAGQPQRRHGQAHEPQPDLHRRPPPTGRPRHARLHRHSKSLKYATVQALRFPLDLRCMSRRDAAEADGAVNTSRANLEERRTAASSYRVLAEPWVGFTRSILVHPVQPRFVSSSISRRVGGRVSNTCVSSSSANGGSMPVSST